MYRWHRNALTCGAAALSLFAACGAFADQYEITLTDLTTGQPFSPPVFATHDATFSMWHMGDAASPGIQSIAETGNRAPELAAVGASLGGSVLDIAAPLSSPLLPGGTVMTMIQDDAAHHWLSSAWMLGRTNDGFTGQDSLDLSTINGTMTFDLWGLDAGTEVNTELAADVAALGGSGHVAENGVIHVHPGIRGIDHFINGLGYDVNGDRTDVPADWRFTNPVARVTITQVPEPGNLALLAGALLPAGLLARRRMRRAGA